jgi:hypothetical protein
MVRTSRVLFFGSAFLALVALGAHALAVWTGQADAWRLARDLLTEARRGEALDSREEGARRYSKAKHAITDEVIAGKLSLTEAAERFAQLGDLVEVEKDFLGAYKGPEGEQELCGNVIVWVTASPSSPQQAKVRARLEAEYRARFGAEPPRPGYADPGPSALSTEVRPPARHRGPRWRDFRGPSPRRVPTALQPH